MKEQFYVYFSTNLFNDVICYDGLTFVNNIKPLYVEHLSMINSL